MYTHTSIALPCEEQTFCADCGAVINLNELSHRRVVDIGEPVFKIEWICDKAKDCMRPMDGVRLNKEYRDSVNLDVAIKINTRLAQENEALRRKIDELTSKAGL